MAGVPHHAASGYVQRLLDQGFKVAICEQMADPSKVKGLVPREVVRVVSPGIAFDDAGITPGKNHYVVAVEGGRDGVRHRGARPVDRRAPRVRGGGPLTLGGWRGRAARPARAARRPGNARRRRRRRSRRCGRSSPCATRRAKVVDGRRRDRASSTLSWAWARPSVAHRRRSPVARQLELSRSRAQPSRGSRSPCSASRATTSATRSFWTRRRRRTSSSFVASTVRSTRASSRRSTARERPPARVSCDVVC